MNRLYVGLSGLLILGGVAGLIGQAWALGAILLVLGTAALAAEIRNGRRHGYVPLEGGPDAVLEGVKAQGQQNVQNAMNSNLGSGQF